MSNKCELAVEGAGEKGFLQSTGLDSGSKSLVSGFVKPLYSVATSIPSALPNANYNPDTKEVTVNIESVQIGTGTDSETGKPSFSIKIFGD
jgi:hypothetical protein